MTGAAATNAKRKPVESQLMIEGFVLKNCAAVFATGEKDNHCVCTYQHSAFVASRVGRK